MYTYFESRGALVAVLQARALGVLREVGETNLAGWDGAIGQPTGTRERDITGSVLRGWGADPSLLTTARTLADSWSLR